MKYKEWELVTFTAASGGWLTKASRDGFQLEERGRTKKRCVENIKYAIDLEMESPWWRK